LSADYTKPCALPVPYVGIEYVDIPEFQAMGTEVGQEISAALAGRVTVEQALALAQAEAEHALEGRSRK
jgi:sorbitol/mannitol transport system substrate-binding protein